MAGERLIYTNTTGGQPTIVRAAPGSGAPETIVSNGTSGAATSDGQTIVFRSTDPSRPGLWKVNADGRLPSQLVNVNASDSVMSPDDRFVIFASNQSGAQAPWMISVDGGTPMQVADLFAASGTLDISPDAKSILFLSRDGLIVCDLPACTARRALLRRGRRPRWSPDGRGVAYVDSVSNNLWIAPLAGGAPRQLTRFTDDRTIADFAWSRDGKRLAVARSTTTNDIVLFRGLRK